VLEGVEPEVRQAGDVMTRRVDAEDAALVSGPVAEVERCGHVARGAA
jgi:hypothetical protein